MLGAAHRSGHMPMPSSQPRCSRTEDRVGFAGVFGQRHRLITR